MKACSPLVILFAVGVISAQTTSQAPSLEQVLQRLERLERENGALREEVRGLRDEVAALKPAVAPVTQTQQIEERLAIQERRTEEQAQTKVDAAQRFPIRLSGMLLNAFYNGRASGGADTPTTAGRLNGRQTGGLTLRQSILGMEYTGSNTFLGASSRIGGRGFFRGQHRDYQLLPGSIPHRGIPSRLDLADRF